VVAGAHPVVIGGGIVGLVVGVSGRVVKLVGLGVLASRLGVKRSSGLTSGNYPWTYTLFKIQFRVQIIPKRHNNSCVSFPN